MTTTTELKKLLFSMILKTPIWLVHLAANQRSVMSIPTIEVLSETLELHSPTILFVIISGYNVPLSQFITVCCVFSKISNYFLLRKSDVIKITRTHSMAMMMSA